MGFSSISQKWIRLNVRCSASVGYARVYKFGYVCRVYVQPCRLAAKWTLSNSLPPSTLKIRNRHQIDTKQRPHMARHWSVGSQTGSRRSQSGCSSAGRSVDNTLLALRSINNDVSSSRVTLMRENAMRSRAGSLSAMTKSAPCPLATRPVLHHSFVLI